MSASTPAVHFRAKDRLLPELFNYLKKTLQELEL